MKIGVKKFYFLQWKHEIGLKMKNSQSRFEDIKVRKMLRRGRNKPADLGNCLVSGFVLDIKERIGA